MGNYVILYVRPFVITIKNDFYVVIYTRKLLE